MGVAAEQFTHWCPCDGGLAGVGGLVSRPYLTFFLRRLICTIGRRRLSRVGSLGRRQPCDYGGSVGRLVMWDMESCHEANSNNALLEFWAGKLFYGSPNWLTLTMVHVTVRPCIVQWPPGRAVRGSTAGAGLSGHVHTANAGNMLCGPPIWLPLKRMEYGGLYRCSVSREVHLVCSSHGELLVA